MTRAQIIGWSHTAFGKSDHPDTESLMAEAVSQALGHAQIGAQDVDGIFVGVFNNGFSKQDFQG
ncbi:MAG: thiolase domain-containing protein, partial [Paracoccaceae bacterium]